MTAEFLASSCLFLSDSFGVSFCLYEVRVYVIILSRHEGQACGRTQFLFDRISTPLKNSWNVEQTFITLCRKIVLPDDTLYLPSIFCCQEYQHVAERIYKVAATWCCLKHLRKICTFYCAHFCRMKNDMASGWIDIINEPRHYAWSIFNANR